MSQIIIDVGSAPDDGTGDPIRDAFIAVNNNFTQIFTAGPVTSNIRIANNTITTTVINGNIVLAPSGIGIVQTNTTIQPKIDNVYDLGSPTARFNTLYLGTGGFESVGNITANYFIGNGSLLTGVIAESGPEIVNGNTKVIIPNIDGPVLTLFGACVVANISTVSARFNLPVSADTVVANTVTADEFIGNITGRIVAPGANTEVLFNQDGNVAAATGLQYFAANTSIAVAGTIAAQDLSVTNQISTAVFVTSGNANIGGSAYVGGDLDVVANTFVFGNLEVFQDSIFNSNLDVAGNLDVGNILTPGAANIGALSVTGNTQISGTVQTGAATVASLVSSGNLSAANITTAGLITATGNLQAGNVVTSGNVNALNVNITNLANVSGNFVAANAQITSLTVASISSGNLLPTANVTYNLGSPTLRWKDLYLSGNTLFLSDANIEANATALILTNPLGGQFIVDGTGISDNSRIQRGTSNVSIPTANAEVLIASGGNLIANISNAGLAVTGNITASGNAAAANLAVTNAITAADANVSGTVTAVNANITDTATINNLVITGNSSTTGNTEILGNLSVTGNITGNSVTTGSITANSTITATGNITGNSVTTGSITANSTITATGNVTGGNISTAGDVSAATANLGNVTIGNVTGNLQVTQDALIEGNLTVNGNVTYVNVENLNVEDPIIGLGRGANDTPLTTNDGKDRGEQLWYFSGSEKSAFIGYDNSGGNLIAAVDTTVTNEVVTVNSFGNFVAGNVLGGNIISAGLISATGNIETTANINVGNIRFTDNTVYTGDTIVTTPSNGTLNTFQWQFSDSSAGNSTTTLQWNLLDTDQSQWYLATNNQDKIYTFDSDAQALGFSANSVSSGTLTFGNTANGGAGGSNDIELTTVTGNAYVRTGSNSWQFSNSGNLTAPGNVTATAFLGRGLFNGNSSIEIPTANGNIFVAVGGVGSIEFTAEGINALTLRSQGNVSGATANITGNVVGGNLNTAGQITATGNVTGGNINATSNVTGTGAVFSGNVTAANFIGNIQGNVDAGGSNTEIQFNDDDLLAGSSAFTFDKSSNLVTVSGNVSAANLVTAGLVDATGNVTGGNIVTAGRIEATGNVVGGNIETTGLVDAYDINASNSVTIGNDLNVTGDIDADFITAQSNIAGGNIIAVETVYGLDLEFTGEANLATVVVSGNLSANNISASNIITATGNVSGGNLTTAGRVDAVGNITGANVIATANIVGGNLTTAGRVDATGNVTGGNLTTAGRVDATGNVTGGNLTTAGRVDATGNVTGGNIVTAGQVTATGNVNAANVTATGATFTGNVTSAANISAANIIASSNIAATGNVSASYFIGNGALLSGIDTTLISNGTSNVKIVSANGNATINIAGTSNVAVFANTGANITGTLTVSGNITGGNLSTSGSGGNITGANVVSANTFSAAANVDAANISSTGNVSATGNVIAGNLTTTGRVDATGNVTGGNIVTAGQVTATGNITGNNITAQQNVAVLGNKITSGTSTGLLFAPGNVSVISGNIIVDGGRIFSINGDSAIDMVYNGEIGSVGIANNVTVGADGEGNLTVQGTSNLAGNTSVTGTLTVSANITAANLTANSNIVATGNITANDSVLTGNVVATGTISATGDITGGNLVTAGNVAANTVSATSTLTLVSTGNVVFTSGGNLVDMGGSPVVNVGYPDRASAAATKQYVDDAVSSGIHIHDPVDFESPGPLPSSSYTQGGTVYTVIETIAGNTVVFSTAANLQPNDQLWFSTSFSGIVANTSYFVVSAPNTSAAILSTDYEGEPVANITSASGLTESVRVNSGIGATLTATANGALTVDSVAVSVGNRILVYEEANAVHNGVYEVTDAGNVSAPWILTRATDSDQYAPNTNDGMDDGSYYLVKSGATGAGESYVLTAPIGEFIIGYANVEFTQFSASKEYSANTQAGIDLSGSAFSAKVDDNTTAFDGSGNIIVKAGANLTTPNIGAATGTSLALTGNITANNASLGNAITAATATITGNVTGGNINTAGQVVATGNLSGNGLTLTNGANIAGNIDATGNALFGQPLSFVASYANMQYAGTANSFVQFVVQNKDNGSSASTDIVATADNGTDNDTYVTMGINSSGYSDSDYSLQGPNDGYLYVAGNTTTGGGNLVLSTLEPNDIVFSTGGAETGNEIARLQHGNGLIVTGIIDASGNVSGGNITTVGNVAANFFIGDGSQLSNLSIAAGSTIENGNSNVKVAANGNVTVGTYGTLVTEFANTGVYVTGAVSATGNVSGGNIVTAGVVDATGNVTGGNIVTAGVVDATGNITTSGNVSANYFLGNGACLTGVITSVANINNGTSNIEIATADANATVTINGTANVAVFADTGVYVTGELDVSGNVTGGNVTTAGLISATGNITGGNLDTSGAVTATGNITGGNLDTSGAVTATGNITGGNLVTGGTVDATGNVSGGNITTAGIVDATGNVSGGNINTSGNVDASNVNATANVTGTGAVFSGNVTADTFIGNVVGNIDAGGSNTQIQFNDDDILNGSAALTFDKASNAVTATGNISGGNLGTSGAVTATGNVSGGNLVTAGLIDATGNITGGNITTSGNVDGANVNASSGITAGTTVVATGNVSGGNLITAGAVDATGNVSGGNITTAGAVDATGNVTGGNIVTAGAVDATGNVTGGNIVTAGNIDGANVNATSGITAGTTVVATGNVTGGNITTAGRVDATGNVTGGNIVTAGAVDATGNVTGGNLITAGTVDATGNVTGGNLVTTGAVDATGNVTGGNINATANVTGVGAVYSGNVTANYFLGNGACLTGVITSVANINNGTSNVEIAVANGNVAVTVDGTANVAVFANSGLSVTGLISATGNVSGDNIQGNALDITNDAVINGNLTVNGNVTYVNVEQLNIEDPIIGLGRGANNDPLTTDDGKDRGEQLWYYSGSEKSAFIGYDNSEGKIIAATNVTITNEVVTVGEFGNFQIGVLEATEANVTGNVTANYFLGNGSQLSGISAGYATINLQGNVTGDANGNAVLLASNSAGNLQIIAGNGIVMTGNATTGNIVISVNGSTNDGTFWGAGGDAGLVTDPVTSTEDNGLITDAVTSAYDLGTLPAGGGGTITVSPVPPLGSPGDMWIDSDDGTLYLYFDDGDGAQWAEMASVYSINQQQIDLLAITSNVIPAANVTYDLGNATNRWNDIWLANSTIHLGNSQISANATALILTNPEGGETVLSGVDTEISTAGNITTTGNISANFFIGDGSQLTNISSTPTSIVSGTSNVDIGAADANVTVSVNGTSNVAVFTTLGVDITGIVTSTGNMAATGNVTGGNITTAGRVDATGNVTGGNLVTAGAVTSASLAVSGLANLVGTTSSIGVLLSGARERVNVTGTGATGTLSVNVSTAPIYYFNSNASGNFTINLNAGTGNQLNTLLGVGEACTFAVLILNGATAYYATSIQVDGTTSGVTTEWQGGSAPSAGNASSIDVYTFTVIKTANAAFTVLAALTKFA